MNLIFLHGPPAAGKLTVGRELVQQIDGRLFDNHASIDFAKVLFDFGTAEFWELVHSVRLMATEQAAASKLQNLICTQCYSDPEDRPQFERLQSILGANNGRILPVYLFCATAILKQRVGNADRVERRKLTSSQGLSEALEKWNIVPVDHADLFRVDTGKLAPGDTAQLIVKHFGLREKE